MSAAAQTVPLFLRQYELIVDTPNNSYKVSSSDFEPNALRFTFDIFMRAYQVLWAADVSIYNLRADWVNDIMGFPNWQQITVTVSAGYKNLPNGYGQIWKGSVLQILFERENVVDTKLTFHCLLGLISQSVPVFAELTNVVQPDVVRRLAEQAQIKVDDKNIGPQVAKNTAKLSRGKTVFGPTSKYFTQIAEQNNSQWYINDQGLNFTSVVDDDLPKGPPDLIFAPPALPLSNKVGNPNPNPSDGVIVGTPQQVPGGVKFTALLDARVKISRPYKLVRIDNSLIRAMKIYQNSTNPNLTCLDQNNEYIVIGARFIGDTRGQPWYVEVDGVTMTGGKSSLVLLTGLKANPNQQPNTNRGQVAGAQ